MKRSEQENKNTNYGLRRKRSTRKLSARALACAGRHKNKWGKGCGVFRVRAHSANPAIWGKNGPKGLPIPKEQVKQKQQKKPKVHANVFQGWGHTLTQAGIRTRQPWLCFRVWKDKGAKRLWNLLPRLRRALEARYEMSGRKATSGNCESKARIV